MVDFFEDWLVWSPNNSRDSQKSYPAPQFESISSFVLSCPYGPASHWYMTTGKTIALTVWTFVSKVISLIFNTLSRFVIAFLPRSTHLLISWLQSPSAVILEPKKIKSLTVSIVSPSICHEVMELEAIIFVFWMLSFKPDFSLSSFTFMKFFYRGGCHLHIWGYWYFSQQSSFHLVFHPAWHFTWCTLNIS